MVRGMRAAIYTYSTTVYTTLGIRARPTRPTRPKGIPGLGPRPGQARPGFLYGLWGALLRDLGLKVGWSGFAAIVYRTTPVSCGHLSISFLWPLKHPFSVVNGTPVLDCPIHFLLPSFEPLLRPRVSPRHYRKPSTMCHENISARMVMKPLAIPLTLQAELSHR